MFKCKLLNLVKLIVLFKETPTFVPEYALILVFELLAEMEFFKVVLKPRQKLRLRLRFGCENSQ